MFTVPPEIFSLAGLLFLAELARARLRGSARDILGYSVSL